MPTPRRIGCCITAHGFGHATRAAAVLAALGRRLPVRFEIVTAAPAHLFAESLTAPFTVHPLAVDIGLVQRDAMTEDLEATLAALDGFYPLAEDLVDRVARLLRGCELVLCDIAPLGIAAAARAGIPSVLLENFTWDWIYAGYLDRCPGLARHIDSLAALFARADYRIQAAPAGHPVACDLVVQPVARAVRDPEQVRRRLWPAAGQRLVLVTMGGVGGGVLSLAPLLKRRELLFLFTGRGRENEFLHNLRFLGSDDPTWYHPDLVAAADMVVGKVGYSTVAETYHAGRSFAYVQRPAFRESATLAAFVDRHLDSWELSPEQLHSGAWLETLPPLAVGPPLVANRVNGADQAADFLLGLLQGDPRAGVSPNLPVHPRFRLIPKRYTRMGLVHELRLRYPPIILLLALLSAFPPLATDMYLPALPLLQREWQVSLVTANLTLVVFFLTYCAFLLVYGPLSDRYGRRPPLVVGVSLFIVACLVCGLADSAAMMIFGRFLQGAGAAASSAIVFAISKDLFTGPQRQRVFIHIGVIVATAPMIAPIIGGWIVTLVSWRWIFLLQALLGSVALVGVVRMDESLRPTGEPPTIGQVAASYLRLLANYRYILVLLTVSIPCVPAFAFIGGSADLYITRLGFSEQVYGYFFGFNALAFVLAPLAFSRAVRRVPLFRLMPLALCGMLASALLLVCPFLPMPWRLTLPMFTLTFCYAFCRPAGNNLILEQVDRDTGAASSLMVFGHFMIGSTAMAVFSLDWPDKLTTLAVMGVAAVAVSLGLWTVVRRWIVPAAADGGTAEV